MIPKEKALELLIMFEEVTCPNWEIGNNKYTKQCALIAVDEILLHEKNNHSELDFITDYWKEVKQEIQKL